MEERTEVTEASRATTPKINAGKRRISLAGRVFWAFLAMYALTWGGHYTSGDGVAKMQWAKQLVSGGPYWTDTMTGSAPRYGIGHSLVAAPGMWLARELLGKFGIHAEAALYTLLFVVNGALLLYLMARYLAPRYSEQRIWMTMALAGLGSLWWPYTKLDFTEPLVLTLFFAAFLCLREQREKTGLFLASLLLLFRTDTVVLIGLLLLWQGWRTGWRRTARTAVVMLPAMVAAVAVNYLRFGTLRDAAYAGEGFTNPLLIGLYGMLFSAGKSIFLFSPPLILGLVGWRRFQERSAEDAWLFLGVLVCEVLLYSRWWGWSGDDCWGVRFVLPGVVLMTVPCIEAMDRRWLFAGVLASGIAVQLPAVLLNGLDYLYISKVLDLERRRQGVEGWNRIDLDDIRFNPRYNQISGTYELLLIRARGARASSESDLDQQRTGTPLADVLRNVPRDGCVVDVIWCRMKPAQRPSVAGQRKF
jgi:hypothetical protein